MSLMQKEKNTITPKLKQVCATLRQQVHTGIAMVYNDKTVASSCGRWVSL